MHEFPHVYKVSAVAVSAGHVFLSAADKPDIESLPPREFGGPGTAWSPEELLVAAVTDCFVLSFKAISNASKLDWISLECETEGRLDQLDRVNQFTQFHTIVSLKIGPGVGEEKAERLLHKADKICLITNSLKASSSIETRITVTDAAPA